MYPYKWKPWWNIYPCQQDANPQLGGGPTGGVGASSGDQTIDNILGLNTRQDYIEYRLYNSIFFLNLEDLTDNL